MIYSSVLTVQASHQEVWGALDAVLREVEAVANALPALIGRWIGVKYDDQFYYGEVRPHTSCSPGQACKRPSAVLIFE